MALLEYSFEPWGASGPPGYTGPRCYLATAVPTTGTYNLGDFVYNIAIAATASETAQASIGWVCTTAGSPGTFTSILSSAAAAILTNTATTGTLSAAYRTILLNAATGPTLSLPDVSTRLASSQLTVKNIAANDATLSPIASNGYNDAAAITLAQNQSVNLVADGATTWYSQQTPPQTVVTTTIVAATSLTAYSRLTLINGASGSTFSLPPAQLAGPGTVLTYKQISNNSSTIAPLASNGYDAAAITLTQFQSVTIISAGGTTWYKQS